MGAEATARAALRLPARFEEFLRVNGVDAGWYAAQVAAAETVPRHVWLSRRSAARWSWQGAKAASTSSLASGSAEHDAEELCETLRRKCASFLARIEGAEPVPWAGRWDLGEQVWALPPETLISKHPLYEAGVFMGVDAASVLAVDALDVREGQAVLDICCAPGAKLSIIADRLAHEGILVGVDACPERTSACAGLARRRWHFELRCQDGAKPIGSEGTLVWDSAADAVLFDTGSGARCEEIDVDNAGSKIVLQRPRKRFIKRLRERAAAMRAQVRLPEGYDRVLVDAQCSHEGSVRHILKHLAPSGTEAASGAWSPEALNDLYAGWLRDAQGLASLQRRLILNGFDSLRPGGRLVYSTCSFAEAQNEAIVEHLLRERPSARVVDPGVHPSVPSRISSRLAGSLLFDPAGSQTSGLFLSAVVKDTIPNDAVTSLLQTDHHDGVLAGPRPGLPCTADAAVVAAASGSDGMAAAIGLGERVYALVVVTCVVDTGHRLNRKSRPNGRARPNLLSSGFVEPPDDQNINAQATAGADGWQPLEPLFRRHLTIATVNGNAHNVRKYLRRSLQPLGVQTSTVLAIRALHKCCTVRGTERVARALICWLNVHFFGWNSTLIIPDDWLDAGLQGANASMLCEAVRHGAVETVSVLLDLVGAYPDHRMAGNCTSLIVAVYQGNEEIARLLLSAGANPNSNMLNGITPVAVAAFRGAIDCVRLLLEHGADLNVSAADGTTPLMWAIQANNEAMVSFLLESGANVNDCKVNGSSPIIVAVRHGCANLIPLLGTYQGDPNLVLSNGATALVLACANGDTRAVENLLALNADTTLRLNSGAHALAYACHRGHFDIIVHIVAHVVTVSSSDLDRLLMIATVKRHNLIKRWLVHFREHGSFNELHFACSLGNSRRAFALLSSHGRFSAKDRLALPNIATPHICSLVAHAFQPFSLAAAELWPDDFNRTVADVLAISSGPIVPRKRVHGEGGIQMRDIYLLIFSFCDRDWFHPQECEAANIPCTNKE
ncbi:Ankyrin repeat domain-containing protein 17 [Hondaea fermentalgiana]|uniref:Ankyrin repeat domain-containing protein 17 n=1 Tax=Hondaea fermentalgiana TaxID=2315210 RepID=A0A2R5GEH0_9STRA|nr:Ankyrin repeat domain-containing protein 17 [Hondaea fermentalgiana]|eukprot:GBG29322.1 Ankyrin repeat domain-containing protein 17 [Hondaea fermentalgiana]